MIEIKLLICRILSSPKDSGSNSYIRTTHLNLKQSSSARKSINAIFQTYTENSCEKILPMSMTSNVQKRCKNKIKNKNKNKTEMQKAILRLTASSKSPDMPMESSHSCTGMARSLHTTSLQLAKVCSQPENHSKHDLRFRST